MWILGILCVLLAAAAAGAILYASRLKGEQEKLRKDRETLHTSQLALRDFALEQLIQGNAPEFSSMDDFCRIYDLDYPADAFMLLLVKVRRHSFGSDPAGLQNAYSTVRDELSGILGLYVSLNFVELDGMLVCFYCEPRVTVSPPSGNQKSLRELLAQHCGACTASLLENHGIDVLIAIGQYDLGGFALHTNYLSTKSLLEQAMCSKVTENVVSDAASLPLKTNVELSNAQRQFYNCFVCFKFDAAAEHLFRMVQLRISDFYDSFPEARETVASQLRFCTNMLELPLNIQLALPDGGTICIRDLMLSPDEESLRKNLFLYFKGLELYTNGSSVQAAPTTERVYSYIQTHFSDPEISVSSISEHFRLNVSYLSRQFKQEYGIGVLESIHKARIARAKDLIATGVPLNEVLDAVGYTSRRAFDSAFSRYEGITPKSYQSQLDSGGLAEVSGR